MKPLGECAQCILKWTYERTASSATEEQRFTLMRTILSVLSQEFIQSGNLGLICKKALDAVGDSILASADDYNAIKVESNQAAEALLPGAKEFVKKGKTPRERFKRACCLASAGNVSPISAPSGALEFPEVENIIKGEGPLPLLIGDVYGAVCDSANIMFFTDNAGEIGFDSLLIGELKAMGSKVTLVVKEDPFFEDATKSDASYFGLDRVVEDILTARVVFIPDESPPELNDAFRQSDLLISKGVFNFEVLNREVTGKPIIYMLKMKCHPLAETNDVDLGSFIVKLENS